MNACAMSSRRLLNGTTHGSSRTAPRCPVPTARVNHVKNASPIFARRLPSFLNTDERNRCAPYLPMRIRSSSSLDEARGIASPSSPPWLRVAKRRQGTQLLGESPDRARRSRSSSCRDRQPARQKNLSQAIHSRAVRIECRLDSGMRETKVPKPAIIV
jgi:hypothetical protein